MTAGLRLVSGWLGTMEHLSGTGVLDAEALMDEVLGDTGQIASTLETLEEPLARLLEAVEAEADLSALGQWTLRWDLRRLLTNVARLRTEEERRPAILDEPVVAPIFITGLPRSGTSFLHRLMAEDPGNLVPRQWQTVYPYPEQGHRAGDPQARERRTEVQLRWFARLAPEIERMHPLHSRYPQECIEITAHVFQSARFSDMLDVPSYQRWLDGHGLVDAYRFHRRFLQHLQSQSARGPWVLKAPSHVFALDDLQLVYPDARFVFVHRDPLKVIPSVARLTEVLRAPFARHVDREGIGRQVLDDWARAGERLVELDRRKLVDDERVVHVRYTDLTARPLDTVSRIYRHFELPLEPAAVAGMRRLVADSPRGGYGRNHYSLEAYGVTRAEVRNRFADYAMHFGVSSEGVRTEGTAA